MSEAKNTPGPWDLRTQRNCVDEYDCYLYPMRIFIPEGVSDADALLIASAPDLLEALQESLAALEYVVEQAGGPKCEHEGGIICFCKENTAISSARAAIAKATGQPHD